MARPEKEITYIVTPSASRDDEFIVTSDASIAADRINIAIVKGVASSMQKADADAATQARLKTAMEKAGSSGTALTPQPASNSAAKAGSAEAQYSGEYNRCMSSGDAGDGVTSAMEECSQSELARQDGRLNRAYGAAMTRRDESQKAALRTEQRAWIKRRDSKCSEELEGGTMDALIETECHLEMTTLRASQLEAMSR